MFLLNEAGYSCYLVGGAVRDLLLGRPTHDYDCTTDARPEEMLTVFRDYRVLKTGLKHGTLTVLVDQTPVEITTYRTDSTYQDHRHPDRVTFTTDLEQDCARRDFTINAMCFHPYEGIIDFFHGTEDLQNRLIRAVGDPLQRFTEDALRILRAIRFAAQLDFAIEEKTRQALYAKKEDLRYVAIERVEQEWRKILESPHPGACLKAYQDILAVVIPQISASTGQDFARVDQADPDYRLRMALLFPDPSKADRVCRQLRLSNADRHAIRTLTAYREAPVSTRSQRRQLLSRLDLDPGLYATYRALLDPSVDRRELTEQLEQILQDGDCIQVSQLAVNGSDLLDLPVAPEQRHVLLEELLELVMQDELPNRRDALLAWLKKKTA